MSYREKSTWVQFVSTIIVFIPYFVWFLFNLDRSTATFGVSFSMAVVASIILNVGGHVFILMRSTEERPDERDWMIEYRSLRWGYFIHAIVMFLSIGLVLAFVISQSSPESHLLKPVVICHLFLFCFVLAEMVRYGRAVLLYRRGVPA